MPTYEMMLRVEVEAPETAGRPENTLTLDEVHRYLIQTGTASGYAVCSPDKNPNKRTGHLRVKSAYFTSQLLETTKKTEGSRDVYMVLVNPDSGCVFVKQRAFFEALGGFHECWGRCWVPVVATDIEDARKKGCEMPGAKPYEQQAPA